VSAVLTDVAATDARTWELKPLAEVADILDGKRIPVNAKEREKRPGRVPYYGATGQVGWIDDCLFDEELVLLGEDGAPFLEPSKPKAYVIRGKSWVNNHAHVLRARAVPTGWLAHFLNVVRYDGLVTGTTRLKLTQAAMRQIRVPVASWHVMEQRVAEIEKQFSRLDEAVANLKRVKANLKRYKAAVLEAAVKGRIGVEGAASNDDLPTGWQWRSVGELATVGTGATPARSNEAFYRGGAIPWITSSAVNEPFVDAADQFVTDEALRKTNLTLYPPGTLLVAMYGEGKTRGKCSELRIAATTNQALAALQADPAVRPWLKLFLEHNYNNTRRIASGGVQPNLNLGLIRAIRLPLAPASEQHRIVTEVDRRLSLARAVNDEADAALTRVELLKNAVLARQFHTR
jgi:type I restriction enzyme S subunit